MGKVSSGDTKELISSPIVFNIFANDGSGDINENLISSAGHTELEEIVNMINALINIQRDLTAKTIRPKPQDGIQQK